MPCALRVALVGIVVLIVCGFLFTLQETGEINLIPATPLPQVGNIVAIDTPMTWSDASAYCQANYAGLASLHSGADQAAAVQACQSTSMKNDPLNPKGCWIGMNDDYEEGAFRWTDGTPNDFRAFHPGEPNGPPPNPLALSVPTLSPGSHVSFAPFC